MPIYEYQCGGCGQVFEVLQRMSDPAPEKHDDCGSSKVQKIMSSTAFVFKGEGWYVTDYARKDQAAKAKSSKKKGGSSEGSTGSSGGGDSGGSSSSSSGGNSTSAA